MGTHTEIKANNYRLINYGLSEGYLRKCFHVHRDSLSQQKNVFSSGWVFAVTDLKSPHVSILTATGYRELDAQRWGFFIPSFSIVHWLFSSGEFELQTLTSRNQLMKFSSSIKTPIAFPIDNIDFCFPLDVDDLEHILLNLNEVIDIECSKNPSSLAVGAKLYIDNHFSEDLTISELAVELGSCRENLTRQFKKSYDISPGKYLNGLRTDDSIRKIMLEKTQITNAGLGAGFNDLSGFNRMFKSHYGLSPKEFKT